MVEYNDILNKYWVFGSKPYEDFLEVPELGAAVRFLVFCLGIIGMLGFFAVVPSKKMFFTKWGQNTMVVYLMQGFFVKSLRVLHLDEVNLTLLGLMILLLISLLLTMLLASEPVQKFKKWIVLKSKILVRLINVDEENI